MSINAGVVVPGPAQLVLTASVARRYYVDGRSKVEIADELGISRFKVARLLDEARESGLVRIEIAHPGPVDVDLSGRLATALGLRHSVVVGTHEDDPGALRLVLGRAAADLLTEIVTPSDVLGLAWARTVSVMASSLRSMPTIPVVQLTGALSRVDGDESSIDVVRDAARVGGGPAYYFHAPLVVPDAATAAALRRQADVARAFGHFGAVTIAVAGVGLWDAGHSTIYDSVADDDRTALRELGVCADISGVFVDAEGTPVEAPLSDRMLGVGAEHLRAVPEVIGIPYGTVKAPAVRAAVRSGLVHSLVTHTALARALLDEG